MFKKYIFTLLLVAVLFLPAAKASDNFMPVRVGISDSQFKNYVFNNSEFLDAYNLNVMDSVTGYVIPVTETSQIVKIAVENNLFSIYVDETLLARNLRGPILISSKDNSYIKIKNLKRKGKQAFYRGYIEVIKSSKSTDKFSIVNVLSLKNYLRGVVPNEMPVRFGLEALKAQTVAARNYAVTPRIKAYKEFDLCDSVACQVYFGANTEDSLADRAIEETNGIIALDKDNAPILALYSSTAGGYTESYEYAFSDPETRAFPSKNIHYLTATPDNENFESLETNEAAEKFYTSKPEAFDDMSPYYRWSKTWNVNELEDVLKKTLPAQSKTGFIHPEVFSGDYIGKLISIKPLKRGASGKIIKLQIETTTGVYTVEKELVIRRCFQKDGISLPSANFVINYIEAQNPVYKFSGGGFGHGVGLSQYGAGKMASLGYKFDDILQHYYNGIKLATIPAEINSNNKPVERTFYTDNNKATLYIENNNNTKNFKITVNGKEKELKLNNDLTTIDISQFLQKGTNKISYLIMDENIDYTKKIKAYVEVYPAKKQEANKEQNIENNIEQEHKKEKKRKTEFTFFKYIDCNNAESGCYSPKEQEAENE
ncbi:SpoIID/LytB domain-containing protein [bacterium]|nr:SpoIID/LytB domain-containing protein [bacterium]